jgi:hypothetical protein
VDESFSASDLHAMRRKSPHRFYQKVSTAAEKDDLHPAYDSGYVYDPGEEGSSLQESAADSATEKVAS